MTDRTRRVTMIARAALPIGTAVRYFPIDGEPDFITSVITSQPWALGHGEIVINIADRRGGVSISHLELVD